MNAPARLELLTEDEAAERLLMSVETLRRIRKRGEIAYVRMTSRMIRYRTADLDEYLTASTKVAGPQGRELPPLIDMPKRPCVYFVRSGKLGPIKIGYAKTLRARLHALGTAHHEPLILLATLAGGAVQEQRLHKQFAALRLRGEWFEPAEELLAFIETIREPIAK